MFAAAHPLVHLNATLNTVATLLLIAGFVLIKQRKEVAHKWAMMSAFVVSSLFLVCYLYYHFVVQLTVKFTHPGIIKLIYLSILASHVILAITVPFLAITAIVLGQRSLGYWLPARITTDDDATRADYISGVRRAHRKIVKFAFPIWLYVSVTGVVVYLMLYHFWPSAEILD